MPVNSVHPQYKEVATDWQTCRDCFEGSRAVKAAGTRYLPKLTGQADEDYRNYKLRATFFPIVSKTVGALVGLATHKPPTMSYPPELGYVFEDRNGAEFKELLVQTLQEILLMGRFILLPDAPMGGGDPYIATYTAESLLNWRTSDNGFEWAVLSETIEQPSVKDEYVLEEVTQYRVLRLLNGTYVQEIYNSKLELTARITPSFSGTTLDFIPLVVMGTSGVHVSVDKSPMLDIAELNVAHYRTSADLEWGRHFVGLPTPVVSGVEGTSKLSIGGTSAWVLPDPSAKAYFLEFVGQGLQSLEKALQEKQGQMATMSARMIDMSTRGSEAAETVRLRYLSEMASLNEIVHSAEQGLTTAYNLLGQFVEASGQVAVELSRDFMATKLAAADLTALFKAYFEGGLSKESLVFNLRRGELLDPKRTDEEEMAAIRDPDDPLDPKDPEDGKTPEDPEEITPQGSTTT